MNNSSLASRFIGIFDSGVGGLTVMRELLKLMPEERFAFYGDTARIPYGEKSPQTILRYSLENADLLIKQQVKMLIVACSTASSVAMNTLQHTLDIPVVGMIEPGAESALQATRSGCIAVLGTKGTVKSEAYKLAIQKRDPKIVVTSIACPLFVPLVEENFIDHPAAKLIVSEYLKPLKKQHIDTILLGCTHYPLLKKLICEEMGSNVAIIDPAVACATHVLTTLNHYQINRPPGQPVAHRYFVSDDPHKFQILGEVFLGRDIDHVESISH